MSPQHRGGRLLIRIYLALVGRVQFVLANQPQVLYDFILVYAGPGIMLQARPSSAHLVHFPLHTLRLCCKTYAAMNPIPHPSQTFVSGLASGLVTVDKHVHFSHATLAASRAHVLVVRTFTRYALFVTSAALPTAQTDVEGHTFPLKKWRL